MGSRTPGAGLSGRAGALKRPFPLGRIFTTAAASEESFAADSFASKFSYSQARNLAGSFEAAGKTLVGGFGAR